MQSSDHLVSADCGIASPLLYSVRSSTRETGDTRTITVAPLGPGIRAAKPGQFCFVFAPNAGDAPISISNQVREKLSFTIRSVGAVTRHLTSLRRGDVVGIRGPFGTYWPIADAYGRDVLFLAGGLGLAPLRLALLTALQQRRKFGRLLLIYGARTEADLLFARSLQRLESDSRLELFLTVDSLRSNTGIESSTDNRAHQYRNDCHRWRYNVGVVTTSLHLANITPQTTVTFMCGPELMIKFAAKALEAQGVSQSAIFVALERSMQCGIGLCGHCQLGPYLLCRDGSILQWSKIQEFIRVSQL